MMTDLIRESSFGQLVRLLIKTKFFQYPEERPEFQVLSVYTHPRAGQHARIEQTRSSRTSNSDDTGKSIQTVAENAPTQKLGNAKPLSLSGAFRRESRDVENVTLELGRSGSRHDHENKTTTANGVIEPAVLDDGTILVDWYTFDDPANPKNWSLGKKIVALVSIDLYTAAVYMGSSIFTPGYDFITQEFPGVNLQIASLGLSMYVLAYGLGPLIWSPITEIPVVGRNPPYILTFGLFVIFVVPAALTGGSFAGLVVLRFLQGFFGSPCLATGGASLTDMFDSPKHPYVLSLWTLFATTGPSLGPAISGFSIPAVGDWRWSMWELLWLAGPIWLFMFFCLPETSADKILLCRAQRLRRRTGNQDLKSQGEIDQMRNLHVKDMIKEALWRPNQLMLLDPSIGFTAMYSGLIYGTYYSFFEVFPLVYQGIYGFNLGQQGLVFLSITIGSIVAVAIYWAHNYFNVEPEIRKFGYTVPERRLVPAIYASFLLPAGLFIFGEPNILTL